MEALIYDFDALPRGEQKDKLMIIKNIAEHRSSEVQQTMMKLHKVDKADFRSILASRRLWSGYQLFNALLRPDRGLGYKSSKIQQIKQKIEALLDVI